MAFPLTFDDPDVEKKIFKELCEVRSTLCEGQSSSWCVFEAGEIEGLVNLHAALCETMMPFPRVPLNHKSASKEDTLPSGHRVQPGNEDHLLRLLRRLDGGEMGQGLLRI